MNKELVFLLVGLVLGGIIGWNDAQVYDTSGKATAKKNNSDEWKKFWDSI